MFSSNNQHTAAKEPAQRYIYINFLFFIISWTNEHVNQNVPKAARDQGDLDTLQRFFGYTVSNTKGKPTNSEFIALIADKLQLQLKSSQAANF